MRKHDDLPGMANVASWIRECDEENFQRFFDLDSRVKVFNARRAAVDLEAMDGLLLTGGPDISAEFLQQEISDPAFIEEPDPARDGWEFETLTKMLAVEKPVLAICKGHQVLNVALGGTLRLDVPGHRDPEARTGNIQPLRFAQNVKHHFNKVNSSHHQVIDRPGRRLEIEAWCASDDVIEQVRIRDYPFGVGVQYHPERDLMYASLFKDFFGHLLNH